MPHVFSVTELTQAVKDVLEAEFPFVWVHGQVTNLSRPSSGHVYFSLKDADAVLNVVWFRSNHGLPASVSPSRLDQGQEILCAGRIGVYPPRGGYQLIAELVQETGVGRLHLEFEALKKKLATLGYFDPARKRPIPQNPVRVAVVTAPSGAAIHDFLSLSQTRGWPAKIRIHPTLVQGEGASESLARTIQDVNAQNWAEVIVLIRGGGSLEDLWTFNTELVAQAVFSSRIPLVCGVGHEVDVTMADLIADVRAATPSHAAHLLWPERRILAQRIDELEGGLLLGGKRFFDGWEIRLTGLQKALEWLSPKRQLERGESRLFDLWRRLDQAMQRRLFDAHAQLEETNSRLAVGLSPSYFAVFQSGIALLEQRLAAAVEANLCFKANALAMIQTRLIASDPLNPLDRGYSLVHLSDGTLVRRASQVHPGDELNIQVQDGQVTARVSETS